MQRRIYNKTEELTPTSALMRAYPLKWAEAISGAVRIQIGKGHPVPVVLRTIIKPFDCYLVSIGGTSMEKTENNIKVYFVTIPAHKYLHIRNYESNGYWDFWENQSQIPGCCVRL